MGGDWFGNQRRGTGFPGGRLASVALAVACLTGAAGLVRQDAATSQAREAAGASVQEASLADQAVPVDGSPSRAKGQGSAIAHQPVRGKAPPPGTRERRELIVAARQSAVDELIRSVESQPIRTDLTVKELLAGFSPQARAQFRELLAASPQIGGARFPSAGTAEVQLQADGAELAEKLAAMRQEAGDEAAISLAELKQRLSAWQGRTFTATGGSAISAIGPELRARPEDLPPEWAGVTEEARRSAFLQARENAVTKFIEAIGPIEILDDVPPRAAESTDAPVGQPQPKRNPFTVEKALAHGNIEHDARQWLSDRPVSRMKYTEDRKIEVKLALEPADWVEQLKVSLSKPDLGLPEITEQDWEHLRARVADRLGGDGAVGIAPAVETERPASMMLPLRAPEWAGQTLTVRASAAPAASGGSGAKRKLMTQQAAFQAARDQLRERLYALPISEEQTLGELAGSSPAALDLVMAFVEASRAAATTYHEDGSVTVEISVAPRYLWQSLERRVAFPVPAHIVE